MTENEAIGFLKGKYPSWGCDEDEYENAKIAIQALEEIKQYKEVGTVEEFKALKEKSVAKKPIGRYKTRFMWDSAYCPNCNCGIIARWNFCQSCGTRIDWSE